MKGPKLAAFILQPSTFIVAAPAAMLFPLRGLGLRFRAVHSSFPDDPPRGA